ncbi:MAG TPA: LamG-like jellyroll fold domain-containing protein [Nitrososphaeraceae archaeon]|nr:LamG-like jellyroll fold domain-containing protein [Nitrososphaeraceae archaeon]
MNLESLIYGQDSSFNNNNTQQDIQSQTSIPAYNLQPFLILNGTDFIDIPHNNSLSLQEFTLATWINTNQSNLLDSANIMNKGGFNSEKEGENMNYGIWFSKNGTIQGGFETRSGENFQVDSTATYNDGKWHYVLLSYNGSLLRLDIDGEKQISTKQTNNAIPDTTGEQPLRLGANSLEENKFFTGYIDEVRVWNRGLTDKEITEIYTRNNFSLSDQIVHQNFNKPGLGKMPVDTNKTAIPTTVEPPTNKTAIPTTVELPAFNIAVAADWGCDENAEKTAQNIQNKDPELVIANGDLSYKKSAECWFEIIQPFKSKLKIAMGDHEYSDTSDEATGVINQYLKPLNLTKTYYSYDLNNAHFVFIDPYIDYKPGSAQYQFIENDLKTASTNPNIDWIFAVESAPMYTSPSKHDADTTIRDTYHPLFDRYDVDLVLSSDNHNYQRTFPLKYNNQSGSSNPIITDKNQTNYNGDYEGQIYLITGTAGRSHYDIEGQAPFVTKQNDKQFGFLNIDINTNNTLTGTFYSNENDSDTLNQNINENKNVIDQFTITNIN